MISTELPNRESFNYEQVKLGENTGIRAATRDSYYYPEHKTPYLFVANFVNKGHYVLNKKPIEISDKHFYFLNANDSLEISFFKPRPLQTLLILFEERFIKGCVHFMKTSDAQLLDAPDTHMDSAFEFPNVPFEFNACISGITSKLFQKPLGKEGFDALLFELIEEFWLLNNDTARRIKKIKAVKKSTREELYRRLFLAKEFISDHASEPLSLEKIAQEVCLNKFHFLSSFKALYNITPHQYLKEVKLKKAYSLLLHNRYSVTDVCYCMGFESIGSFSNSFTKRFKISPSSLKRGHKIPNFE